MTAPKFAEKPKIVNYSVFCVFFLSFRALQGAFWGPLEGSGPLWPLGPSGVLFGGYWVASTADVVRSGDGTQRNSAEPSGNQPERNSGQRSKLWSVVSIVVDLLIIDRSTVAGLLLQLVGHVLLRLWLAAVSNDPLKIDF